MDERLEHGDGTHRPKSLLVFRAARREIPQRPAGVGHDRQRFGFQVFEEDVEAVVASEDFAVIFVDGDVAGNVPEDSAAVFHDGEGLRRRFVGQSADEKLQGALDAADVRLDMGIWKGF